MKRLCPKGHQPNAKPESPLRKMVVDTDDDGEAYLRVRQRKLKPVRDSEQVSGFGYFYGRGKHPKGPGARPKKAKRQAAVRDALRQAGQYRWRQCAEALGPYGPQAHSESGCSFTPEPAECDHDGPGLASQPESSPLALGQHVQLREQGGTNWLTGTVISPSRLVLQLKGGKTFSGDWDAVCVCNTSVRKYDVIENERCERRIRSALRQHIAAEQRKQRIRARDAKRAGLQG